MTAEERMAYFQGEKQRQPTYHTAKSERNPDLIFLKIKFLICVILFVLFLSLDYTGCKIKGIGSEEIIRQVTTDFEIPEKISL